MGQTISGHAQDVHSLGEKHNYHKNREALVVATIRSKADGPAVSAKRN
jgi:hypothetical protein